MKTEEIKLGIPLILILIFSMISISVLNAQQVEVAGELKVTQMQADNTEEQLVTRKSDGTLGTRSVASLPLPPPSIDTLRNLASDLALSKQLCDCPDLPPFMIQKLLDSGYTQEDLVAAGVNVRDVIDAQKMGILIDSRDNKAYKTVTIGTQTWMAENLNFGTRIDGVDDPTDNAIVEKYCYDDLSSNCDTLGGLYQWDEMMQYVITPGTQGVCPTGWHLPTDDEWKTIEMTLGMTQAQAETTGYRGTDQGSQLAGDELLWTDGALDQNGLFGSSGMTALPAGFRNTFGSFGAQSITTTFWSSSEASEPEADAWYRNLNNLQRQIQRNAENKSSGWSVRCVKD